MSGTKELDYNYLRSISGILKIYCLFSSFIGFLCIIFGAFQVHIHNFRGLFYICTAVLSIICTTSILLARIFQLWKYKFYEYEAVKYEMYMHATLSMLFFMAAVIAISLDIVAYSIAAFFGFLTAISYGCNAYLNFQRSQQRDAVTQTENTYK